MPFSIIIRDRSDYLFYLALAMLPVDGTVIGVYMPFWTPISPWLFLLYVAMNWRSVFSDAFADLPDDSPNASSDAAHSNESSGTATAMESAAISRAWNRLRMMADRNPAATAATIIIFTCSCVGWFTTGIHLVQALNSLLAIAAAVSCVLSLRIAVQRKRLPWRPMINILLAVYWLAFAVGVIQRLAVSSDITVIRDYFSHLMSREYITAGSKWGGNRPQFLFAEPSYIGMHLFGVLLPLYWLLRRRAPDLAYNLAALIITFAIGSVVMGAGTRIVLDSLIVLMLVIVMSTAWRQRETMKRGLLRLSGTIVLGILAVTLNSRLSSIASNGADGDGSFFARIWQSLGVLCGMVQHPVNLLFGFGAGNLSDATHTGASAAVHALRSWGFDPTKADQWYAGISPDSMFTMSAYTSFLGEFGVIGFVALVALIIECITRAHVWNKITICWLILVAYLYIQFEGYAFYAIPLFLWALRTPKTVVTLTDTYAETRHRNNIRMLDSPLLS